MNNIAIILIIEAGDLEQKVMLAVDSIRRIQHRYTVDIMVVKPRKGPPIGKKTLDFLRQKETIFIDKQLNIHYRFYPFANKIFVWDYVPTNYSESYDLLIFLDSDTILLSPIESILDYPDYEIAVKPDEDYRRYGWKVGTKGHWIWHWIYEKLDIQKTWTVTAGVGGHEINAYFNAGVVICEPRTQLFQNLRDNFIQLSKSKEFFRLTGENLFFFEQMVFSATLMKLYSKEQVQLLDNSFNYPLNHHNRTTEKIDNLAEIKILHYHDCFYNLDWTSHMKMNSVTESWIMEHLPFKKHINSRRLKNFIHYQKHKLTHLYGIL